jgi:hypothetical protein
LIKILKQVFVVSIKNFKEKAKCRGIKSSALEKLV